MDIAEKAPPDLFVIVRAVNAKKPTRISANASFLTNVICPLLSGIPLLVFALYFFYLGQGPFRAGGRVPLFPVFLLTFGLFILGRPVQLLVGPHPWPAVVNCLRFGLFGGICGPLLLYQARTLTRAQKGRPGLRPLLALGGGLAAVYTIAMAVGTGPGDTTLVFEFGPLKAYDITPRSWTPPLFVREITMLCQLIAGLGFFGLAGYETLKAQRVLAATPANTRHLRYFALGCLIYGGALIGGTLAKQWWFYYLASVPAVFFIGLGVREDLRYVSWRAARLASFLHAELFHAFGPGNGPGQEAKVRELKGLLGKKVSPTLVLVMGADEPVGTSDVLLSSQESALQKFTMVLDEELGETGYLLLPAGRLRFVLCVALADDEARALAEKLRSCHETAGGTRLSVGIGGTHPTRELQLSFLEAQSALRGAEQSGQPIVSYPDLGALPSQRRFPVEARTEFLLEFKYVHRDAARQRLSILLDQLAAHVEGDAVACRVHLLELLGLIFGAAGEQTGHRPDLVTETASILEKLSRLDSVDELTGAIATSVDTLLGYMEAPPGETTSRNSLRRAKAYIDQNYATELKISEVAKQAGVSTSQLQRIFRDALGMTYSAYLTTIRMQKAKELLASTDRPITEIAFEIGYNDSNYFSTAFRKHEGISPSQYRRPRPA